MASGLVVAGNFDYWDCVADLAEIGTGPGRSAARKYPVYGFTSTRRDHQVIPLYISCLVLLPVDRTFAICSISRWRFLVSIRRIVVWAQMALYLLHKRYGPAMVVCFTFLSFYSISTGNYS